MGCRCGAQSPRVSQVGIDSIQQDAMIRVIDLALTEHVTVGLNRPGAVRLG
jgi:hypothetical protein